MMANKKEDPNVDFIGFFIIFFIWFDGNRVFGFALNGSNVTEVTKTNLRACLHCNLSLQIVACGPYFL